MYKKINKRLEKKFLSYILCYFKKCEGVLVIEIEPL